jgi:hypothetical protein
MATLGVRLEPNIQRFVMPCCIFGPQPATDLQRRVLPHLEISRAIQLLRYRMRRQFVILKTFDRVRAWLLSISQRQLWCAARMRLVNASG